MSWTRVYRCKECKSVRTSRNYGICASCGSENYEEGKAEVYEDGFSYTVDEETYSPLKRKNIK